MTRRSAAPDCCGSSISTSCSPPPKRWPFVGLVRQAARHLDQRRRRRCARGGSSGRSWRRTCRHFAGYDEEARCRIAADLVARQSGRYCRRRRRGPIRRRARAAARRRRQRCRPGDERADGAGVGHRCGEIRHRRDRATAQEIRSRRSRYSRCGWAKTARRRQRSRLPAFRTTRPNPRRSPGSCISCTIRNPAIS